MKKTGIAALLLAGILLLLFLLPSCATVEGPQIHFIADEREILCAELDGDIISKISTPEKENYVFSGWFFDKGTWQDPCKISTLLNMNITKDVYLYAHFVEDSFYATVTFDTGGGSEIAPQKVEYNTYAFRPEDPTREGYSFCGWYTYPDYAQLFSFSAPITKSVTAYAKWEPIYQVEENETDYLKIFRKEENARFVDSAVTADGDLVFIFQLGTLHNVILTPVSGTLHQMKGETVSMNTENVTTDTLENHFEETTGVTIGASVTGTCPWLEVSLSMEVNQTWTKGWSQAVSTAKALGRTVVKSLDDFAYGKYYDVALVGDEDIFQYFIYSADGSYKTTGVYPCVANSFAMLISSDTPSFSYGEATEMKPLERDCITDVFGEGTYGTREYPYCVDSVAELLLIAAYPQENFKLTADIDMKGVKFTPISHFEGILDGDGHTIRNYSISGKYTSGKINVGLFGLVSGIVENLAFESCSIDMQSHSNGCELLDFGIVAGQCTGFMINLTVTDCTIKHSCGRGDAGGIVGRIMEDGVVDNCSVKGLSMYSCGDNGGIAGSARDSAQIFGCQVQQSKTRNTTLIHHGYGYCRSSGGLIGYFEGERIENSLVTNVDMTLEGEEITASQGYFCGNLTRGDFFNNYVEVKNCTKTCNVTLSYGGFVFGIGAWDNSGHYFKYDSGRIGYRNTSTSTVQWAG